MKRGFRLGSANFAGQAAAIQAIEHENTEYMSFISCFCHEKYHLDCG